MKGNGGRKNKKKAQNKLRKALDEGGRRAARWASGEESDDEVQDISEEKEQDQVAHADLPSEFDEETTRRVRRCVSHRTEILALNSAKILFFFLPFLFFFAFRFVSFFFFFFPFCFVALNTSR
jgi:hypothetical protein